MPPGGFADRPRTARAEAVPLLEETERRARRLDKMERSKEADMYDWASRTLAELRGS